MTPEEIHHVFDKFWRADASNKAVEGTGLGMSIMKYIAEAHGGTVKVKSAGLGKGTRVTVELAGNGGQSFGRALLMDCRTRVIRDAHGRPFPATPPM